MLAHAVWVVVGLHDFVLSSDATYDSWRHGSSVFPDLCLALNAKAILSARILGLILVKQAWIGHDVDTSLFVGHLSVLIPYHWHLVGIGVILEVVLDNWLHWLFIIITPIFRVLTIELE